MPFAGRVVQPLGHEVLPGSLATDDPELMPTEVSNGILVTVLEQMKCLVRHADDIFCDITEECHKVVERTEKVNEKVKSLTVTVENLDYRNVPIPVGSLKVFCQKENGIDHFAARHGYDCLLFAPDTRPQSLKDRYNMAAINPVEIIRRCDEYRRDGVKGSMLFRQWPVFVKQPKSKTPDLSFRKLPPVVTFEKDYKPLKLRNIVIKRCDSGEKDDEEVKPDTEVIPINTSGVAFQRMCSFRQLLRSVDGETTLEKDLKKKRRQTFSGVPPSIWKEICAFESSKSEGNKRISIHDKLKSYSFDDLDSVPGANEEGELIKYLNQVEDRIEEREELEHSLSENKFLRLIPCRRSCSLPRSAKLTANRQRFHNSRPLSKCEAKSETTLATLRGSTGALANKRCSSIGSTLSLYSAGSVASSRQSRSTKRSSLSGVKRIKSLLNVGKPTKDIPSKDKRPKSLDLDALEVDSDPQPRANLNRTPSMPEGMHSSVGPGSFYYFDNNTLPKTLAKKYDFPWESLPKDWTTSVKLREISKRRVREDRNSSSGNWSGSSARQSMESERAKSISASHRSLGTDSGRESPTPTADGTTTDTAGEAGDEGSVIKGNGGRTSVDKRSRSSRLDTEAWLRNLSMRAAARVDSSSSSETLNSLKVDVPPMEDFTGDIMERYHLMDDDASSVYSLDQEGFYTSFHTDSGLRRSTTTLWEEEEASATVTSMSPVDDTDKPSSVQSVSSNLSADSVIYKPLLKTVPSPVIMRPPPKRQASSGGESDGSAIFTLPAQTPQPSLNPTIDFSFSESDQEIIYARVKQKTKISTTMYPSLCDVSNSSDSEEDGSKEKTIGTDRLHNQKPLFDPDSVKVVELSPGIKSSLGAVEGQRVHNRLDGKDYSSSKVLSTFSSGSDDQLDTKVLPSPVTATVCVTSQPKHNTSAIDSRRFPSQNFSSVSSLERKSSSSAAYKKSTLKHSGSLDDSNLLESSGEDKSIKKQVFNSLPRHYHVYKRNSYGPEYTNSWPRSHQSANDASSKSQPASGILKSTQKQSVLPKAPKTLNFSPVVNMFDPGTPETIQVFPTSSGESPVHQVNRSNLPQANSFKALDEPRAVVKLENARPISSGSESDITHESELPAKYQPSLVVRPGKRTSSSGSDVSPYATSSVTQSLKRNSVSSNPGDLGIYRKSLVTSPTVDSGIGSVGDLSPSTPTSSVGTDEDFDKDYSVKKVTSPNEDSVFPHSVRHRTQDAKYAFLNNPPTLQAQMSVEKKLFGADIVGTGADIEYADDSDNTEDTPTHQPYQPPVPLRDTPTHQPPEDTPTHQPYQPPVPQRDSSSSTAQTNGYGIVRSSLSDSKLMDSANNNKVALPSRYSCSSLPPSGMNRTEGVCCKVGSQTSQNVSPSTRTSSYRNACSNTSRSPSYRFAQNQLDVGSKVVNSTAVPAVRSESYRVACEDLVPPPVPEHRNRADPMKKATDPESAARAESYRVAIEEMEDPEIFEYKAVNKRAAITSLDQLLPKPAGNASKGLKSPKQIKRSITDSGFFARFRGKQDKSSSKLNTSATEPVKGSYVPLGLPNGSKVNSKPKAPTSSYRVKPKSSTYMSFDILSSVEEVKEDSMHGSLESVKAPSMSSLQSFQSGQSAQSFLRRDSSDTQQDDNRPLVRRGHQHTTSKSSGPVIRPSTDNRRRSTGSTSHSRIIAGPHSTSAYKSLLMDDSMETGV